MAGSPSIADKLVSGSAACGARSNSSSVAYCMFSRYGGSSEGRFASLNIAANVGDTAAAVAANRELVKRQAGVTRLVSAHQTHGTSVYCLKTPIDRDVTVGEKNGCDALVTDVPGTGLMIQHADCQAILLFDPVTGVIAAVHSGWRGSVQNIAAKVVGTMTTEFGCDPADINARISPSLGPCCAEFIHYREELPEHFYQFMTSENYFDFWKISRSQLTRAGLLNGNIAVCEVCTVCCRDYFSYRRARPNGGVTGRNCSVIALVK
ncbi:peptidoglycan editing factor PgeF [Desulforhopalus singaporensis]|uniref:Purine nucleoside phosphorylase n=1 Tax=Desulforhopalus singaporensis TaxID=91360 RepID=A0A1H0QZL9_9BACT|nr:peptidoglycan editing factor PgeF [Desulforhopalus singaporensis]SDP22198.1 conserved hypothetical protein [Desulforhopalus singaporensis]